MSQYELFAAPAPSAANVPTTPALQQESSLTCANIEDLEKQVASCSLCKLSTTRTQSVFGEGNLKAELMFIGEGPGRQEDLSGRPFVGPAGQFLTLMIEKGMKVQRSSVYICNIVKCRPTVNLAFEKDRPPEQEEIACCAPYLVKQIRFIQPKVIVAVGGPAAKFLLNSKEGITRLRGKWSSFQGIDVMPIYHPSYILRNGGTKSPLKRELWEDMKLIMQKLDWPIHSKA